MSRTPQHVTYVTNRFARLLAQLPATSTQTYGALTDFGGAVSSWIASNSKMPTFCPTLTKFRASTEREREFYMQQREPQHEQHTSDCDVIRAHMSAQMSACSLITMYACKFEVLWCDCAWFAE